MVFEKSQGQKICFAIVIALINLNYSYSQINFVEVKKRTKELESLIVVTKTLKLKDTIKESEIISMCNDKNSQSGYIDNELSAFECNKYNPEESYKWTDLPKNELSVDIYEIQLDKDNPSKYPSLVLSTFDNSLTIFTMNKKSFKLNISAKDLGFDKFFFQGEKGLLGRTHVDKILSSIDNYKQEKIEISSVFRKKEGEFKPEDCQELSKFNNDNIEEKEAGISRVDYLDAVKKALLSVDGIQKSLIAGDRHELYCSIHFHNIENRYHKFSDDLVVTGRNFTPCPLSGKISIDLQTMQTRLEKYIEEKKRKIKYYEQAKNCSPEIENMNCNLPLLGRVHDLLPYYNCNQKGAITLNVRVNSKDPEYTWHKYGVALNRLFMYCATNRLFKDQCQSPYPNAFIISDIEQNPAKEFPHNRKGQSEWGNMNSMMSTYEICSIKGNKNCVLKNTSLKTQSKLDTSIVVCTNR
ncbi:MAG: hypothetical protein HQK49_07770 [Oligoflexia bacterium]|nr:hypothetical protein [Oligoflexia bacterium]